MWARGLIAPIITTVTFALCPGCNHVITNTRYLTIYPVSGPVSHLTFLGAIIGDFAFATNQQSLQANFLLTLCTYSGRLFLLELCLLGFLGIETRARNTA